MTESPTAEWTARQIFEAVGLEDAPKYLIRDQDRKFTENSSRQVASVGIKEVLTASTLPWQNACAERAIGTIRRECLDQMIIFGELHLRRTVKSYSNSYNRVRTHLSLDKDSPRGRIVQFPHDGAIRSRQQCGGLHHGYYRQAA